MDTAPSSLFNPVRIGPLTLKHRVVMAPMTTLLEQGGAGRYEAFYDARARGGAAMITLNLQAVWPGFITRGSAADPVESDLLALNHDRHLPRLTALVARLHAHGAAACAQLAIGGSVARAHGAVVEVLTPSGLRPEGLGVRPDAARLPFFQGGRPARADDLAVILAHVARAARRAEAAGFDAVQISAAGGSLPAQFLSPRLNLRDDEYGGTLAGRARLALDALRATRAALPPSIALLCRINGDDLVPGGMAAPAYAELVPMLEAAGAQAIDILPGGFLSRAPVNQSCVPEGAFAPVSRALTRRARVPVFAGTRVSTPECAARIVARGDAAVVSLGAALIADPDWPAKARDGRGHAIRPCTACCRCWNDLAERHVPVGCSVNPSVGDEDRPPPPGAEFRKRVTIVGAGVAGLTAAVDGARAGHHVTVIDRRTEVGGLLVDVLRLPHKEGVASFLAWLGREAAASDVVLRLGVEATPAEVMATHPDVVILAAGHVPADLEPDVDPNRRARSVADVLGARVFVGASAVVFGAGRDACETAEWLAMAGTAVTLAATEPARDLGMWTRGALLDRLEALGVRIVADTRPAFREAPDAVVVRAVGWIPATALEEPLETVTRLVVARGNADAEDGVGEAVRAGLRAALAV